MAENGNGKNGTVLKIALWSVGIIFVAGGVYVSTRITAAEIPAVRAEIREILKVDADLDKRVEINARDIRELREDAQEFKEEQKTQTTLLREISRRIPRGSRRGNDDR